MVIGELEEAGLWSQATAGGREELEQLDQRLIAISRPRSRFQLANASSRSCQGNDVLSDFAASAACSSLAALRLRTRQYVRRGRRCPT